VREPGGSKIKTQCLANWAAMGRGKNGLGGTKKKAKENIHDIRINEEEPPRKTGKKAKNRTRNWTEAA